MIQITKPHCPQIIVDNKANWTNDLMEAVQRYGSYEQIPLKEKEKLIHFYKHNEIKVALFEASNHKCSFCETKPAESGNIEVEHFAPKSIYPHLTFEWDNLLPSCRKCNEAKGTHDTIATPIVDPSRINPEAYFDIDSLCMIPATNTPNRELSENTIRVCKLNSTRLLEPRSKLLLELTIFENGLKDCLEDIRESDTFTKRRNRILKLIDAVDTIELLTKETEKFSAFCKKFLTNSTAYMEAKNIISEFHQQAI